MDKLLLKDIDKLTVSTSSLPPVQDYDIVDIVTGSCVLTKSMKKDLIATIKNTVGGELLTYTELLEEATAKSLYRIKKKAVNLGAHGIFAIRLATPQISGGAAEVLVIGTAYKKRK